MISTICPRDRPEVSGFNPAYKESNINKLNKNYQYEMTNNLGIELR
jgi:hypothetical protein